MGFPLECWPVGFFRGFWCFVRDPEKQGWSEECLVCLVDVLYTDHNFHSRNQHVTIYSYKLNFMWMIFLWGKFTMKVFTSLLFLLNVDPPRRLSPFWRNAGLKGVWKFCSQCRVPQVVQKVECWFLFKCSVFVGWFVLFLSCNLIVCI